MKQEILFVLLKDFADWEGAYIAPYLNYGCGPDIESKYVVKTVSVTKAPVVSCGGFTVLPDYSMDDILADYAGIVLIGGMKGECRYIDSPAVREGNVVTANGFSALEFCREILYALDPYTPKMIEESYRMNKTGVWEAPETE